MCNFKKTIDFCKIYDIMLIKYFKFGEEKMIFKDYYKILELKTNKVSIDEIKNAYRAAVKKNHPDLNLDSRLAEEKIKDINEAYKTLSDNISKRKYDRIWKRHCLAKQQREYKEKNQKNNTIFKEFFNMFFGSSVNLKHAPKAKEDKKPIKGENVETIVDTDIEEVFYGIDKKISLRTTDGKLKVFTVSIPAGIRNGEKIRLLGQGKAGKNGGKNGDLLIRVNIKDNDKFRLKGNDLYTKLYLTPWEAALGTKTKVYSIDEESILYIPNGIETGETLKISGKGYKDGKGSRGDLFVSVNIMVPKELSNEEKELYKKLSKISTFNPRNS